MEFKTTIGQFRAIAILEGISFLILIFIGMPLKYMAGLPLFVKYMGWAHGILFISYLFLLIRVKVEYNWSLLQCAGAILASLLPFGPFVMESRLRKTQP
ncbi:MAG: DUF3817 domain-containing protein [Bacteroidia bacterium]|nr:DUF3817 domain-containing protein [Bacteroidia bacterium]